VLSAISDDDQVHALTSIAAMRAGSSWRSFLFEQRALIAELPQLQRALFQITVPTMIVTASRDSVVPARTQRALNCDIRHNRSVTINGGHDLPISHAGEVAAAITRLWDEVAPR
jgi:pimeloyl-ACP methyl ester carboxylesterase